MPTFVARMRLCSGMDTVGEFTRTMEKPLPMPPWWGVKRQHCGQMGKQENCRIAVSVSMAAEQARKEINSWPGILPLIEWPSRKAQTNPFCHVPASSAAPA